MKLKDGLIVHDTPDGTVAVATGKIADSFNGMIRMSASAALILHALEHETTEDAIVTAMLAKYDVAEDKARRDARGVLGKLREAGLLDE